MIMYHITSDKNIISIKKHGLLVNQPFRMTQGGKWAIGFYGVNPIYFTKKISKTLVGQELRGEVLKINTDGLKLIADLPSLVDMGGACTDDGYGIYWKEDSKIISFKKYFDDDNPGVLYFSDLLNPDSTIAKIAIKFTGTAACIYSVSHNYIRFPSKFRFLKSHRSRLTAK